MRRSDGRSLWDLTVAAGLSSARFLSDAQDKIRLVDVASGGALGAPAERFRGRVVLVASERQLVSVLALMELDGIAARLVLCPPDLDPRHLPAVIAEAGVDAIVSDGTGPVAHLGSGPPVDTPVFACRADARPAREAQALHDHDRSGETEWVLFTSGTLGQPKLAVHTMATLTAPIHNPHQAVSASVWSTFYDVRRYGGLQILLRALLGGGSMVLSQAGEPVVDFLARLGQSGVARVSGTPSHWRRALMSGAAQRMSPSYVRLSGEAVDQSILSNLGKAYPAAQIGHAFATTEAGVAFEVNDGLSGFPAALIQKPGSAVDLQIQEGSLRIRSSRMASRYLGSHGLLLDAEGFVDTRDMVQLNGDRYYFIGRRDGVINVGGQKVYPEEVEAVIHRQPDVRIARVSGRANPITGAVLVADIVLDSSVNPALFPAVKAEILSACRGVLSPYKVPSIVQITHSLDISEAGKLQRSDA
jgi:acyl-CoA synthetase (AMP-forming)/AMP-acid ligase II